MTSCVQQASGERVNLVISRPLKSQAVSIIRDITGTHNSSTHQHQSQQLFHSRPNSHKVGASPSERKKYWFSHVVVCVARQS